MTGFGRRAEATAWKGMIAGVVMLAGLARATAGSVEVRDFNITVDGKQGGAFHLTISQPDADTAVVAAQGDVRLTFAAFVKYTYAYRGNETWKNGRLVRLDSSCNDNGKRFVVNAFADGHALRVRVNGQERTAPADAWATTYWHLADAKFRNGPVALIDADTGRDINATLQYVGTSQLTINGQAENCTHYRLTGGVQVELWYDGQERLVRQESLEDGKYRTVFTLTGIRR